jgi:hypothetical protein
MERVTTLINKLQNQLANNNNKNQLLQTAQLLVAELLDTSNTIISPKISIIMPQAHLPIVQEVVENEPLEDLHTVVDLPKILEPTIEIKNNKEPILQLVNIEKEFFEINDLLHTENESLNDLLKIETAEIAETIVDSHVKDLRRAIDINDKYLFINELFQGNESVYLRSIKTINEFENYETASLWITRELHTKMFWNEESLTVKKFDNLVKRRFF